MGFVVHHKQYMLSIAIDISESGIDIINVYTPKGNETRTFISTHQSSSNCNAFGALLYLTAHVTYETGWLPIYPKQEQLTSNIHLLGTWLHTVQEPPA